MPPTESRIQPPVIMLHRDSEGEFAVERQHILPVDGCETVGNVVGFQGHLAGPDSLEYQLEGVRDAVLGTPYGATFWTFGTRYGSPRSIGHRVDQAVAVLKSIQNEGDGRSVAIAHSEGNHVWLGATQQLELVEKFGGFIGLGMVAVNPFAGAEPRDVQLEELLELSESDDTINIPMLGLARAIAEEIYGRMPSLVRENCATQTVSKVISHAGRLGLSRILPDQGNKPKVPLGSLAAAGVGEVVDILPHAAVSPEARRALITLLSNVMKLSVGSNPFGEGHQILTSSTSRMSAELSAAIPMTHITGTRDRLSGGSIKEGLLAAGYTGDVHEYDLSHLELLLMRPVVQRVAHTAVRYMFGEMPDAMPVDDSIFELTPDDQGIRFIIRAGAHSLRQRLGTAA